MDLIIFLQAHPVFYIIVVALLGLCVGSFLNVVIYRLPQMLLNPEQKLNLCFPGSFCPHCLHAIPAWQNVPVLSYCLLRGRCAFCHEKISPRYIWIEIITALLSTSVALYFGVSWTCVGVLFIIWSLIPLIVIDWQHQILPDQITLPLLWGGLLCNIFNLFTSLQAAVIGAMVGYLSLWLVMHCYKLITGKIGMGHGDFKLLAALGAWLGWQLLPFMIIFAALLGIIVGGSYLFFSRQKANTPIAFGPFIAVVGWLAFFLQTQILQWSQIYLGFN